MQRTVAVAYGPRLGRGDEPHPDERRIRENRRMSVARGAAVALAGIRLVNGTTGVVAPQELAKRLGADADDPALLYALRLFGVRTVVIALDLLRREPAALR